MTSPRLQQHRDYDEWILSRRGPRNALNAFRPHAFLLEEERADSGEIASVATVFLTNRECPWRCLMCDLWKNTVEESVPIGAIPAQIDYALAQLEGPRSTSTRIPRSAGKTCDIVERVPPAHLKLYNSGSFFDPRAIPPEDHPAVAARASRFERVIVECHPALVGASAVRFRELLESDDGQERAAPARLEVAMGLETAHPEVLERLNKRMTLDQFSRAAGFLSSHQIALRVFVLVKPPFLDEGEALEWARRSIDFAFECGATAVSLIPTRPGNGALDTLAVRGEFSPPKLSTLEAAQDYGVGLRRGRVFADVWDLARFAGCAECFPARQERLRQTNLRQIVLPPVACDRCGRPGPRGTLSARL